MKELIEYVAKSLVSNPAAVTISETNADGASVFELTVAKEDLGRIIGKQGRTAKSLRTRTFTIATRTTSKSSKKNKLAGTSADGRTASSPR